MHRVDMPYSVTPKLCNIRDLVRKKSATFDAPETCDGAIIITLRLLLHMSAAPD